MIMLKVFTLLLFAAVLSSCEQKGPPLLGPAGDDIKEVKEMIRDVYHYLIGERAENPCVVGVPQTQECFYVVTVVEEINKDKLYQVQTSHRVCTQNKHSGNPLLDCEKKFHPVPRWITVFGDPPLKKGDDYDLFGQKTNPPTSQLACHDKNNQVTKNCVARTTDLPVITALQSR